MPPRYSCTTCTAGSFASNAASMASPRRVRERCRGGPWADRRDRFDRAMSCFGTCPASTHILLPIGATAIGKSGSPLIPSAMQATRARPDCVRMLAYPRIQVHDVRLSTGEANVQDLVRLGAGCGAVGLRDAAGDRPAARQDG